MKCYFENDFEIVIELDTQKYFELFENDLLIYEGMYSTRTKINIQYNLDKNYYIKVDNEYTELDYDGIYDCSLFEKYNYDYQLGVLIKDKIYFTVWAPLKNKIDLIISKDNIEYIFNMNKENGVFKVNIDLSYLNFFYVYRVYNKGYFVDSIDPYATCVINNKGYLLDQFNEVESLNRTIENNQRIIYELHVTDYTYQLDKSNKFLGLIDSTGFNHIKELGVTDIQLLPIYDYEHDGNYNWGYMPLNFNSLTSIYSINEFNKINEFKEVVNFYHQNNIGIIMDVVYNHTSQKHCFNNFVPGYYYRKENNTYCNGSGCGNEIATQRYMVRKYIVDSICYWAEEYKLDGFRFDLMAIIDIDTLNIISTKLKEINGNILLYGEAWSAANPCIDSSIQSSKQNLHKLNNIYGFNDTLRDAIKGNVFDRYAKGFIQGENIYKDTILNELNSNTINYVSCHDNHTLCDKLNFTTNNITNAVKQANAIILLSKGITFLHSGVEICRTKNLVENSYNSSIEINKFDWDRKKEFLECFIYYKNLIAFKKKLNVTNITDYYIDIPGVLSYKIHDYIIIHNNITRNYIKFNNDFLLVFHNNECNIIINELHLMQNDTYIIKELD